jgi:prepilin signal peptidase PulO-like enzyme (type II secretory pathway)
VLGWALQRGRCSTCGKKISAAYPAVEAITAALLAGLFLLEGPGLPFLFHALYVAVLMLILVNDWRYRDIYLSVIAAGCVLAIAGSLVLPGAGLVSALLGAGVAGAFFLLAYLAARVAFRHIEEPLGLGDVFLALLMGLMLGFPNIVGVLVVGPLIAGAVALLLLVTGRSKMGDFMPYGVSLCAAAILFLLSPKPLGEALHLPALQIVFSGLLGTPN